MKSLKILNNAYGMSEPKLVESIEKIDSIKSLHIAMSHIENQDFKQALENLKLCENDLGLDSRLYFQVLVNIAGCYTCINKIS
jgi:hypothetical protein